MKRALFLLFIIATLSAGAQTALYKRYANRQGIKAYCVERYPLNSGDSVCVTLLQTDDSALYRTLLRELHEMPYSAKSAKRLHIDGTIHLTSSDTTKPDIPEGVMQQMKQKADSLHRHWRDYKNLVIFNADGLPGDRGYYAIYCPSDRMVVLAFLITGDDEALKVAGHMTYTELIKQ